ncbi:MAG: GNAT family N-acetyltransferase [Rhodospirillales bacterium]|nr:GNAT family N-acetyltransferase [Rhodospirillales bacterium]MDE0378945.1 GNAT family N-acetyltransferase [Rhodospirillales bacterium]
MAAGRETGDASGAGEDIPAPDGEPDEAAVEAHVLSSIAQVDEADWDRCAGRDNPFVRHAFLWALEESGSSTAETGWHPRHIVLKSAAGAVLGAVPMYLKNHSYGEYVFDHGWADAFERAGGRYYPKLQVSVPFTPVTGPRLLAPPGPGAEAVRTALLSTCVGLCDQSGVSSLHVTFPTEDEFDLMGEAGLLQRTGIQFHWLNEGYGTFDDFLASLASRKRKQIRKERQAVADAGLTITALSGPEIEERHWDAFFVFYQSTGSRKWGVPYLTRAFFSLLSERMADQVVLVMVERAGKPIAGALNLAGSDALYGRNWGCIEEHRFLHFEACYYRAIDYAIAHGLGRVEAGAQGPHKLARGYLPVPTYSAHWVANESLRDAVANYLDHETREIDREIAVLERHGPFRQSDDAA